MTLRDSDKTTTAEGSDKENTVIPDDLTKSVVEGAEEGGGVKRRRKAKKGEAAAKTRGEKWVEPVGGMALGLVEPGPEIVDDVESSHRSKQERGETAIATARGGGGAGEGRGEGREAGVLIGIDFTIPAAALVTCATDKDTTLCFESPQLQSHVTEEALEEDGEEQKKVQEHVAEFEDQEPYLSENTLLGTRYRICSILGHGNFSTTYLAEEVPTEPEPPDVRRKTVAIKRLKLPYSSIGENEFSLLEFLHCQGGGGPRHIISPIECFFSETDHFHLVLEPLDSARPVSLPQCACLSQGVHYKLACPHRHLALAKILVQLLSGLLSLHSHHLIHADLTPANVLFLPASNRIKLIDFGNAIRPEDREVYLDDFGVQSACYRAPEILLGSGPLSRVMDVWGAGVIAVELLLDGEVVGKGLEAGELMRSAVQGRDALVKRTVELVGSVKEYAKGMYYTDVYDDISLEPVVFTPRKRKRKWPHERCISGVRTEREGILREYLEETTRNVEMVDFLMNMMEVGVRRRKTVTGMLKHPWLVRQLLGDWGDVLVGGVNGEDGQSDVTDGVKDQPELDVLGGKGKDGGDLSVSGQSDGELKQFLEVDHNEDIQELLPDSLEPDSLPPLAKHSPSPCHSSSPYNVRHPYSPVWEDISNSPLEDQVQSNEMGQEHSSSLVYLNSEEDAISLDYLESGETDNSAPETSLVTNDTTTNMTLGKPLFSSPPSSPPLPAPLSQGRYSIEAPESCSLSPVGFVGKAAEPEQSLDKNEDAAAALRRVSDVWHRDLAANMDDLSEEADDSDDQVMLC